MTADNDIPDDDDKTRIAGQDAPAQPDFDPFGTDDDDPFALDTPAADPVPPVDEVMDDPAAAVEEIPEAVDPEAEPEIAPDTTPEAEPSLSVTEADAPAPPPVDDDRTIISSDATEASVEAPATVPPVDAIDDASEDLPDAEPVEEAIAADGEGEDAVASTDDVTEPPVTVPPESEDAADAAEDDAPEAAPMPDPDDGPNPNDPVPVGTMINNNYEIKELISAGGMGEVFRGANAFTGDAVAIKIVLQSLANDPKIAALFMREAKVLCGLSDQAIVRYYNFVRDADLDRFCLIMEFIDGVSLSDFTRDERPITSEEARDLLRKVARGLERAHSMDVVHRDLSPDNVMLRDGDVSRPVLIDFGIAKSTEMAENTLHGQLAGKFKYISPEQLGHFGGEIGPRTDIYGLALLIAAALRGTPIDMGSSVVEAVHARSKIPDLDGIPEDMQPLLSHMLEPDPADRPAHMADVIRILDDPSLLPAKYGGSGSWEIQGDADRTVIAEAAPVSAAPQTAAPEGLRLPPGSQPPAGTLTGGLSMVPGQGADSTSASPFGASVPPGQTAAPTTAVPGLSMPPTAQQTTIPPQGTSRRRRDRDEGGGIGGAIRWVAALALIAGLGGYVAYTQGLLPESITGIAPPQTGGETEVEEPVAQTENGTVTRRSFLANYEAGECSFADRIAAGQNTGTIEGFTNTSGAFDGLQDDFEALFDSRPAVQERIITDEQCAVLDLARLLQKGEGVPPVLSLDSDEMASGGSIVGRLRDRRGRPVWLVLVTTAGGVYNLTDRMTEQADGSATFSFGLNASGSGGAEPQLIMAVASDSPLIAAAAATNGARASSLLPLIEAEISGRNGVAGATVAFFDLLP